MSSVAIDGENVPWSRTSRTIPHRLCLPLLKALVTYGTRVYTKHRRLHRIFCYLRRINLETLCFSWVKTIS